MFRKLSIIALISAVALIGYMYSVALRDPLVRTADLHFDQWPAASPPVKIMLISDIHVAGPDMPPPRLARIVAQINQQNPDIVLFAGDFVSDRLLSTRVYDAATALAPLAKLHPRLGSYAVLGNHDHWRDAASIRTALEQNGITSLSNSIALTGPLIIGGIDDAYTHHADVAAVTNGMVGASEFPIILSHSPDIAPQLPSGFPLLLAGHTHCGQISLPLIGPMATASEFGRHYVCGLVKDGKKTVIITAGLGTSILPLRYGAVPDMWLITVGKAR